MFYGFNLRVYEYKGTKHQPYSSIKVPAVPLLTQLHSVPVPRQQQTLYSHHSTSSSDTESGFDDSVLLVLLAWLVRSLGPLDMELDVATLPPGAGG